MKTYILSLLVLLLCTATVSAQKPPVVFSLNPDVLKTNKSRVFRKEPEVMQAYRQLLKDADKALAAEAHSVMEKKHVPPSGSKHDYMSLAPYHWPDPSKKDGLPYMRRDGQTNPEVKEYLDKEYMPRMCEQVHTLALAYYFSGDERYADKAAVLLRTWFLDTATRMNPNLNFAQAIKGENQGRGAGLIDARHFMKVTDAIGLLQTSRYWRKTDQSGMKQWFRDYLHWMQTSPNGIHEMHAENNHGTWYDAQRMTYALFLDSTELARNISTNALNRLNQQMDAEGKFPKEMERTIALHYNTFNLEAFFLIATLSEKLDLDFWHQTTADGRSLKKGFNYLHPFLSGEQEWKGQQIKEFDKEEGLPILLMAAEPFNCKKCWSVVRTLAGEKAWTERWNLLY